MTTSRTDNDDLPPAPTKLRRMHGQDGLETDSPEHHLSGENGKIVTGKGYDLSDASNADLVPLSAAAILFLRGLLGKTCNPSMPTLHNDKSDPGSPAIEVAPLGIRCR